MKDRNKLLTQILIVSNNYGLEINKINFININSLKDIVEFTFEDENNKFTLKYSYEKDDIYKINNFANYFRNEFDDILKGGLKNVKITY